MERQRLSHAYIFSGPAGVGKTTAARAFAKWILCESTNSDGACGICRSCLEMDAGSHPDYIQLPKEKNSQLKKESTISIADIRWLAERLGQSGYGTRTVVVLRNAENMTREAANAFLKLLEEPPENIIFLLTSSQVSEMLPTVMSRVQEVIFSPLSTEHLRCLCEQSFPTLSQQACETAVDLASGSYARMMQIIEHPEIQEVRTAFVDMIAGMAQMHPGQWVLYTINWGNKEKLLMAEQHFNMAERWFVDALIYAFLPERNRQLKDLAQAKCPPAVARKALQWIQEARQQLSTNVDANLIFMMCLQKITLHWQKSIGKR